MSGPEGDDARRAAARGGTPSREAARGRDEHPGPEPPFALCGPGRALVVDGVQQRYDDVRAAKAALRSKRAAIVLGALPFDVSRPAALLVPNTVASLAGPPDWPTGPLPSVHIAAAMPTPAAHRDLIARARDELAAGGPLRKVVLARGLRLVADAPLDARVILQRLLVADPAAYGYVVDLSAAGGDYAGTALVGASPELLVARAGEHVMCRPFAGSAPRAADPQVDAANADTLAASAKNRHEHRLVVDTMRAVLQPLCDDLVIAPEPELSRTATVWHLCTPMTGRLRDKSTTAIDLALALHPTPAVGGVPTRAATGLIAELEGDRGFYAGAVGWCDASGDGEWVVAIRCAQLSADRRSALARAGGGIVAESDPDDEVAETTSKFATILNALKVEQ